MRDIFTLFPAIDLRGGQVVRLAMGDPARQTIYSSDPAEAARRWLEQGARWMHVVNLDGAFGDSDLANTDALASILREASAFGAFVQFGGGLRSLDALEKAFAMGVTRVVLGTAVIEDPELVRAALARWGSQEVAAGIDARGGQVATRGWKIQANQQALDLAQELRSAGLDWLIYTDIARDGMQAGLNLKETCALAKATGLRVIASGGAAGLADVREAQVAGLAGVIAGRALYEGSLDLTAFWGGTTLLGE